ncbi:hypothetical protein BJF90_08370 [Pseudonocardia sp. CNS-004]|nr:hypothetical protein BJF90_08370 [Pseudonocardia sp. CNS-004]
MPFARTARVEAGRQVRSLDELDGWLPRADVVASALPLGPQTRRIVDAAFLARLRDGALFGNVGRGATVDTGASQQSSRPGVSGRAWTSSIPSRSRPTTRSGGCRTCSSPRTWPATPGPRRAISRR